MSDVIAMESLEEYASRTHQSYVNSYARWHEAGNELAMRLNAAEKAKPGKGILGNRSLGLKPEDVRSLQARSDQGSWNNGRRH